MGDGGSVRTVATMRIRLCFDNRTYDIQVAEHRMREDVRPGAVGAGLSETVRVTKSGCEALTGYPTRELIAL